MPAIPPSWPISDPFMTGRGTFTGRQGGYGPVSVGESLKGWNSSAPVIVLRSVLRRQRARQFRLSRRKVDLRDTRRGSRFRRAR